MSKDGEIKKGAGTVFAELGIEKASGCRPAGIVAVGMENGSVSVLMGRGASVLVAGTGTG